MEYIYTGEVEVEPDKLQKFLNTAKELSLCGINKVLTDEFVGQEAVTAKSLIEVKKDRYDYEIFHQIV